MVASRARFRRQESWRLKRVKENWRRPRGVTSRMRKEKKGWPVKVKIGYGTKASTRGLHPRGLVERFVENESDLEGLDSAVHIVRLSGRLGERRRLVLLDRVKSLNIHIANPGKEGARPVSEEEASPETDAESERLRGKTSAKPEPEAEEASGDEVEDNDIMIEESSKPEETDQ